MTNVCSVGIGEPSYEIHQNEVKDLAKGLFPYSTRKIERLMPVFDNANINKRQLVVEKEWFLKTHTFQEKNDLYIKYSIENSLKALDDCLSNSNHLNKDVPYEAIDLIVFVSSTGIATPSIDVHLLNRRPFRENITRMPLWGLGCAGGAMGLSRVNDWISANPSKTALLVCCELCSLTFQRDDISKSNIIGTALFGDGASAVLAVGEESPYLSYSKGSYAKIKKTSSYTKKESEDVMGWDVSNKGLEVIFSKNIPSLVNSMWKNHVHTFLNDLELKVADIHSFVAHPGGRKVLEAMENSLDISRDKLFYSYETLKNHGNMSSATVLYVLNEWMQKDIPKNSTSVLASLGPGFSSELLLLEWR